VSERSPSSTSRVSAGIQVGASVLAGILVAVPVGALASWALAPILTWDIASVVYLAWVWLTIWRQDADGTARLAEPEDPTRALADLLLLSAAVISLVAVAFVLSQAASSQGSEPGLLNGLAVASVVLSWGVVHTVFTLRYARLYYLRAAGGVDFNHPERPSYSDFAYLAFTIGMTFQVSDTDLTANAMRRTALHHALLSYLFGTGILATTINLIANSGNGG
jgi:uncharacterized membrane protein